MTDHESDLIQRLAMSLDTCLDLVADEAKRERRREAGNALRNVTWEGRQAAFGKLVNEARAALVAAGRRTYF